MRLKRYKDYQKDNKEDVDLTKEEMSKVEWTKYKIVVPTEEDRQQLMAAFEHIHYSDVDSDIVAVNQLIHEYLDDSRIEGAKNNIVVDKKLFDELSRA